MEWRLEPADFEMILAFVHATRDHGAPTGCEPGPGLAGWGRAGDRTQTPQGESCTG